MRIVIRPVKIDDAEEINKIRTMKGVFENTFGMYSERITFSKEFIENLGENDHMFVAVIGDEEKSKIVGFAGLHIKSTTRFRHIASTGIMIHSDYQGMNIGKVLLSKLIDLSDNWLKLIRLEALIFPDNEKGLRLYNSAGFEIEGTKKYGAIKNGEYCDVLFMARYNINKNSGS